MRREAQRRRLEHGTARRWAPAGTDPPGPAAPPGPADAARRHRRLRRPVRACAGPGCASAAGDGRPARPWISSRTSAPAASVPGRAANTSSWRSASSWRLRASCAAASRSKTSQSSRSRGCSPIDNHGGPGLRGRSSSQSGATRRRGWINRRGPPAQVWTIPAWKCAPVAAMLSPLCATALIGPAPHGPDRISTDVCAGQCSSDHWDPAAQLQQALRRVSRAERSREQAPGASWRRARPCKRTTQGTQPVWRTRHSSARRSA